MKQKKYRYLSAAQMQVKEVFTQNVAKLVGFSRYLIHEDGKVYDLKRNKLKTIEGEGYRKVVLTDDFDEDWSAYLHHLIARCFIGEIPEGYDVSHLTDDTSKNAKSQLSICTHKENCNHGERSMKISRATTGKPKIKRQYKVINHTTGEREIFDNLTALCKAHPSQSPNSWNYRIMKVANFTQNWYEYEEDGCKISVRCLGENRKETER